MPDGTIAVQQRQTTPAASRLTGVFWCACHLFAGRDSRSGIALVCRGVHLSFFLPAAAIRCGHPAANAAGVQTVRPLCCVLKWIDDTGTPAFRFFFPQRPPRRRCAAPRVRAQPRPLPPYARLPATFSAAKGLPRCAASGCFRAGGGCAACADTDDFQTIGSLL